MVTWRSVRGRGNFEWAWRWVHVARNSDPYITLSAWWTTWASVLLWLFEKWKKDANDWLVTPTILEYAWWINNILNQKELRAKKDAENYEVWKWQKLAFNIKIMTNPEKNGFKKLFWLNSDNELEEYFSKNNLHGIIKLFLFLNRLFPYVDEYKESKQFKKNKEIDYRIIKDFYKDNEGFTALNNWYDEFDTAYKEKIDDFLKNQ